MVGYTNAAGRLDPGQIRGWMTLADISGGYRIPLPALYAAAKLPASVDPATRLNQVAKIYRLDFEPDAIREVVAGFLSGPPAQKAQRVPAVAVAPKAPPVSAPAATEQKARPSAAQAPAAQSPVAHPGGDAEVKGFMTLNEIASKTGVPAEHILKTLAVTGTVDARQPVREWMHSQGKSIQDIRDAVTEYRKARR
jgi:hypothetical protein